jgi:GNAT-family acetyltransferase (TIGR03103 family)
MKMNGEATMKTTSSATELRQDPLSPLARAQIHCGWGRLLFAQTFPSSAELARALCAERKGERDIAIYVTEPHLVLAFAPQELFLDPSHTFRLQLARYRHEPPCMAGYRVRALRTEADARQVASLYAKRRMIPIRPDFLLRARGDGRLTHLVAEDLASHEVVGTVTGVDHVSAFVDPERGCSLWALAVDPQTPHAGVGHALVASLLQHFSKLGRAYLDLSVVHDNQQAISLYEKLEFVRVPVFSIKCRNSYNEPLYTVHTDDAELNPYARVIAREARRRGIAVDVLDRESAYLSLSYGGRTVVCRESLSELTSAVAMSRCDDKRVTRRVLNRAGLRTPEQITPRDDEDAQRFLQTHGSVVVKPSRGEQGQGISVDVRSADSLTAALRSARAFAAPVLLEQYVRGDDLRVVVIDYRVVAAAVRRPPAVVGDGQHSVQVLIEKQSRRRAAATHGESRIPLDAETERCVQEAGYALSDVLPVGVRLIVRKAANVHTGGTIHDVTEELHPQLRAASERAAEVLDIPVVGLDLIVPSLHGPEYWIIEANERPGLANHEPQPTVERYIDLLFPQTAVPTP